MRRRPWGWVIDEYYYLRDGSWTSVVAVAIIGGAIALHWQTFLWLLHLAAYGVVILTVLWVLKQLFSAWSRR